MARLDRLATVKEVAQLGAVLGREFAYDLLQAVSPLDEATLQQGLAQSRRGRTALPAGAATAGNLSSSSMPSSRMRPISRCSRAPGSSTTSALPRCWRAQFPETAETQPELLAHHYTEAGLSEQAVGYWQRAGQRAVERSALCGSDQPPHQGTGAAQAPCQTPRAYPAGTDRADHSRPGVDGHKGFAAPEVEQAYARARELCQQVGDTPQLFPVLRGLWVFYIVAGGVPDGA